jgi:hypothetical protein
MRASSNEEDTVNNQLLCFGWPVSKHRHLRSHSAVVYKLFSPEQDVETPLLESSSSNEENTVDNQLLVSRTPGDIDFEVKWCRVP